MRLWIQEKPILPVMHPKDALRILILGCIQVSSVQRLALVQCFSGLTTVLASNINISSSIYARNASRFLCHEIRARMFVFRIRRQCQHRGKALFSICGAIERAAPGQDVVL